MLATTRSSSSWRRPEITTIQPSAARNSAQTRQFRCRHRLPRPRVSRYLTCKLSPLLCGGRSCYSSQRNFAGFPPLRECCMNTTANANVFSRLFDTLDDPNRLAIEMLDGVSISYGDLIARAGQMANVLVSRGVKPGDRVAAQAEKSCRPSCCISRRCARARSTCRSTPPTRWSSSTTSSATPSRRFRMRSRKAKGIAAIAARVRQGRDPRGRRQGIADHAAARADANSRRRPRQR